MNILITGTSKGIGLGLTKIALQGSHDVWGIVRTPTVELKQLNDESPHLKIIELDLSNDSAMEHLQTSLKGVDHFDLVINNAGIFEKAATKSAFLKSFAVNTYAPFMVTQLTLPLLKKAKQPKLIHVTSLMGSITDNSSGGSYAYRASKSALNMINKCITVENPWLTTAVLHPGWVQTSMGGSAAPTSVEDSTEGLWRVISELRLSDSGSFLDFRGKQLPW